MRRRGSRRSSVDNRERRKPARARPRPAAGRPLRDRPRRVPRGDRVFRKAGRPIDVGQHPEQRRAAGLMIYSAATREAFADGAPGAADLRAAGDGCASPASIPTSPTSSTGRIGSPRRSRSTGGPTRRWRASARRTTSPIALRNIGGVPDQPERIRPGAGHHHQRARPLPSATTCRCWSPRRTTTSPTCTTCAASTPRAIELYAATRRRCERLGDRYHRALCDLDESELSLELNLTADGARLGEQAFERVQRPRDELRGGQGAAPGWPSPRRRAGMPRSRCATSARRGAASAPSTTGTWLARPRSLPGDRPARRRSAADARPRAGRGGAARVPGSRPAGEGRARRAGDRARRTCARAIRPRPSSGATTRSSGWRRRRRRCCGSRRASCAARSRRRAAAP